jgi:hypothetical protein
LHFLKYALSLRNNEPPLSEIRVPFSRTPPLSLWSSGQSSWLHNGDVLYFL